MYIVLSQRIDTESTYSDELFKTYHFPVKYRGQIKPGDIFVYNQGDRKVKENRYYFGTGTIGNISSNDYENYYAEILTCEEFINKVPIHDSNGGYLESIDYMKVRKSVKPPWQSSIRPISEAAFKKIVKLSGGVKMRYVGGSERQTCNVEKLKDDLKKVVKSFYLESNDDSILSVIEIAQEIAKLKNLI